MVCFITFCVFRVDDLYKFLSHWVPELYGELGDVTQRGYTLVDSDTELWDDEVTTPGDKVKIFIIIIFCKNLFVTSELNDCMSNEKFHPRPFLEIIFISS